MALHFSDVFETFFFFQKGVGGWKILNCTMIRENENMGGKTIEWKFFPHSLPSLLLSHCKIHSKNTLMGKMVFLFFPVNHLSFWVIMPL